MSEDKKAVKTSQTKGKDNSNLSKGAEIEREQSTKRTGTGAIEKVKPASSREVSPNTPSGEDL